MESLSSGVDDFNFLSPNPYVVFGGSFDPPHLGHINIALAIVYKLGFDVVFMPNGNINYKKPAQISNRQRIELLKIVLSYNHKFYLSYLEINSVDLSLTYHTLKKIRNIIGYDRGVYFVIGSDSLITLDSWDNWLELVKLTNFIVISRPNYTINIINKQLRQIFYDNLYQDAWVFSRAIANGFFCVDVSPMDISSTQIRQKCSQNQSITNLVTPEIEAYILNNNLYR